MNKLTKQIEKLEAEYAITGREGFKEALSSAIKEYIAKEIQGMKLWSKGTVEGTRNDIIAKLEKKLQEDFS